MDFTISIDIVAPPEVVFAVMSDVERWPAWTPSVKSIRKITKGPLRPGTLALVRQPKMPPAVWKVTTLEPGRSFIWISGFPGFRVLAQHAVAPSGPAARATLTLRYEGPLGRLFGRLTRDITNQYLGFEAEGLKRQSEANHRAAAQ